MKNAKETGAFEVPMHVVQLLWEGPLTMEQLKGKDYISDNEDYGIYAVYGTHSIFGPNSLLYIGQANSNPFGQRIPAHEKVWSKYEASDPTVFVGRICNVPTGTLDDKKWGELIDDAEKILIFECSPPYNSKGLKTLDLGLHPSNKSRSKKDAAVDKPAIEQLTETACMLVVNLGRRHRLPLYCSSYFAGLSDVSPESFYRRRDVTSVP